MGSANLKIFAVKGYFYRKERRAVFNTPELKDLWVHFQMQTSAQEATHVPAQAIDVCVFNNVTACPSFLFCVPEIRQTSRERSHELCSVVRMHEGRRTHTNTRTHLSHLTNAYLISAMALLNF